MDKKSVRKCREETRLALLSVPPEKVLVDCFQTQTVISNKFILHAHSFILLHAISHLFVACDIACVPFVTCNQCDITLSHRFILSNALS